MAVRSRSYELDDHTDASLLLPLCEKKSSCQRGSEDGEDPLRDNGEEETSAAAGANGVAYGQCECEFYEGGGKAGNGVSEVNQGSGGLGGYRGQSETPFMDLVSFEKLS
jgi:hypothetical protein